MSTYKPAGTYELQQFVIESYPYDQTSKKTDLKAVIHNWSVTESILSGAVRGKATIYDAIGLLYQFPIKCQEKITIRYKDFKGVEREEIMFLYSITDIKPSKQQHDNMVQYTVHFVSWGKFWSDRNMVRRCIAQGTGTERRYLPISRRDDNQPDQVKILFDDYYVNSGGTDKKLITDDSTGEIAIVIPALKPEDAMHLLSRKAYSEKFPSSMFRFFESREAYYFINLEEMLNFAPSQSDQRFFYSSGPVDQTPEGELLKMQNIISVDLGMVDTLEAINSGAYNRRLEEVDTLTRRVISHQYNHTDEFENILYPDENIELHHTKEFVEQHMDKQFYTFAIKDYPDADMQVGSGIRPHTYYGDIYNYKNANLYHYSQSRIGITIFGTNELFAGSFVTIDLPEFQPTNVEDVGRSGNYIVEGITNEFVENTYYQRLSLIKGGVRKLDTNDV